MTDLEMTRLCAEAMGLKPYVKRASFIGDNEGIFLCKTEMHKFGSVDDTVDRFSVPYDPLHDDAQAMALVKRFKLYIEYCTFDRGDPCWLVVGDNDVTNDDLNRAICACVSRTQKG